MRHLRSLCLVVGIFCWHLTSVAGSLSNPTVVENGQLHQFEGSEDQYLVFEMGSAGYVLLSAKPWVILDSDFVEVASQKSTASSIPRGHSVTLESPGTYYLKVSRSVHIYSPFMLNPPPDNPAPGTFANPHPVSISGQEYFEGGIYSLNLTQRGGAIVRIEGSASNRSTTTVFNGGTGEAVANLKLYPNRTDEASVTLAAGRNFIQHSGGTTAYGPVSVTAETPFLSSNDYYNVTPSAGANGSISPATAQATLSGARASFTLTPNSGSKIAGVGGTCGGYLSGFTYTTAPVTSDCTVVASFSEPDSPEAFVERHYVYAFGRPSDPAGLASWVNLIYSQSAATVPISFLTSAEFTNRNLDDYAFVNTIYQASFDRPAQPGELSVAYSQLTPGRLREMLVWDVVRGTEFKQLADLFGVSALSAADEAAYGIRAFTERFYTVVLVRYPDPAGFDGWVSFLTDGTYSGSDLARGFFLSPEYVNQNKSDSLFLDDCYQAYFDRAADPGGKQGWLDLIAQGMSREQVLDGFSGSQEFIKLAESYGIRPFDGYGVDNGGSSPLQAIPTSPAPVLLLLIGLLSLLGCRRLRSA